jgi:cysteinyl-tRNA synthetase
MTDEEIKNHFTKETYNGAILRLQLLMTHYRQPLNFTEVKTKEAGSIFEKWLAAAIPNQDSPPEEVINALLNDLNTPQTFAEIHKLRKSDGRKLYAALRFLGFFDGR